MRDVTPEDLSTSVYTRDDEVWMFTLWTTQETCQILKVWVMQSRCARHDSRESQRNSARTYRAVIVESAITPQACVNVFKAFHQARLFQAECSGNVLIVVVGREGSNEGLVIVFLCTFALMTKHSTYQHDHDLVHHTNKN